MAVKKNRKAKLGDGEIEQKGKMQQKEGQPTEGKGTEGKGPHSIRVPQLYKQASVILKKYENKEGSLKTLIYSGKYTNYGVMFGLLTKLVKNQEAVKSAIAASNLLVEQPSFDPHLAQVLATQALSKGSVVGKCKPIVVFKEYEEKIKATAANSFSAKAAVKDKDLLPRYVRINTLVSSVTDVHAQLKKDRFILQDYDPSVESYDDFLERVKNLVTPYYLVDYHIPELLVFPPGIPFWNSFLYKKNAIILQDKASCLPVFVSDIQETSNVLDACAAPGNKTSYIAAKMNNQGKVIAVENDLKRFETLVKMIRFRRASCVTSLNKDFFTLKPDNFPNVEHIFVDPSCSSSGTTVHNDEVSKERIAKLASLQTILLKRALSFPSVKEVIYSTCSVYKEENEQVIEDVLTQYHEEFELADLATCLKGWKHFGHDTYSFGNKCLRTDINIDKCTGFFVAKFVRKQAGKGEKRKSADEECHDLNPPKSKKEKKSKKSKKL
ncbi:28S rRNA (cytosine-C(5))-methyltransferase-like isoform X2 [Macrobrachium nipponense]|uniref:28S rRNA (cytosine-C(5))-methyltransferase-like isoform X2 n=1 Tax=Macrobrachium nipponense TaxID=159736 RepID=UPI0030C8C369